MWLSSFWMAFNQIIPWLMEIKKILSVFNVYLLIFKRLLKSFLGRLFEDYSKIINWLLKDYWKDYWKGGRGQMKKLPPFQYQHFTPKGWSRPRTPHFFCLNHLYMDPIWKINRFVCKSSKCVFGDHLLIVCWLSADNLDYADNRWLSVINSGVYSWWGKKPISVSADGGPRSRMCAC